MTQLAAPHRILCFGSFEVDTVSVELRRQGLKIRLQDQPFRLLVLLLERAAPLALTMGPERESLNAQQRNCTSTVDNLRRCARREGSLES